MEPLNSFSDISEKVREKSTHGKGLHILYTVYIIILVYRFRKLVGKSNFSEQFRKLINRYKRIGYSLNIMRQTACLVVNPFIVDSYASLFNCTTAVRALDSMTDSS